MIKLIGKTDIFKIQPGYGSPESSEFVNLFLKLSAIMNTKVSLKNDKIHARKNWSQNEDKTDIFEGDENTDVKKKNKTMIDFDYASDNKM